jgi:hypothetical protein
MLTDKPIGHLERELGQPIEEKICGHNPDRMLFKRVTSIRFNL